MYRRLSLRILWHLTHVFYCIVNYLCTFVSVIPNRLKDFKHSYSNTCALAITEVYHGTVALDKVPTHMTVLLGTEDPSYVDLTKIILWSITAGVSFISFYDCKGILKKHAIKFKNVVDSIIKNGYGYNIIWHDGVSSVKNGYTGKKIHVKLLCQLDGRQKMLETALNAENITTSNTDSYLRKSYEFPDPQMAIYCGDYFNLYGYPPWQIRLTEFFNVKSHRHITPGAFVDLLRKFNKCEQRLGK